MRFCKLSGRGFDSRHLHVPLASGLGYMASHVAIYFFNELKNEKIL